MRPSQQQQQPDGYVPTRDECLDRSAEIAARIWNSLSPERQQQLIDEAAAAQQIAS